LVQNLDGVSYLQTGATGKKCELAPPGGMRNLEKVLASITSCPTFEAAAAAVSATGIKRITIDYSISDILKVTEQSKEGLGNKAYTWEVTLATMYALFPPANVLFSSTMAEICAAFTGPVAGGMSDEEYIRAAMLARHQWDDFGCFCVPHRLTLLDDSLAYALLLIGKGQGYPEGGINTRASYSRRKHLTRVAQETDASKRALERLLAQELEE